MEGFRRIAVLQIPVFDPQQMTIHFSTQQFFFHEQDIVSK